MPPKQQQSNAAKSAGGKQQQSKKSASSPASASHTSHPSNVDFLKSDDGLQGVLLADSFQVKFRPLTQQKPKVLLPLLNIPLLDYSLEFLVSGQVTEIFVFCRSHAGQVQAYLAESKWSKRKGVVIRTIISDSCLSFGDAMRHLDHLDIIKRDFVLISGDVITNLKLDRIVQKHKERVKQDKRNMMTLIFKQASYTHRTRALNDDAVLGIDPVTSQLLLYENNRKRGRVAIDVGMLNETRASTLQLRYDLMDSHISICTPDVLNLFTDNFDWQSFHADFLTGMLGSEILGNKLFVHIISRDEYAARCEDLRAYDSVSKDVIHRWTYPLVPDNNLLGGGETTYKFSRGNNYREDNVSVSRDAKVGEETTIGSGTSIATKSNVKQCVIGRDCTIGSNVTLAGSYIWNNVIIEDGAFVDRAILADGVIIRAGARIERGAILAFNVVIGPGHVVKPYTKITTTKSDDSDDEANEGDDGEDDVDESEKSDIVKTANLKLSSGGAASSASSSSSEWSTADVGVGGVGRIYTKTHRDEDEAEDDDDNENGATTSFPFNENELNSIAPNPQAVSAWLRRQFEEESEDEWEEVEEKDDDAEDDIQEEDDETAHPPGGANASSSSSSAANLAAASTAPPSTAPNSLFTQFTLESIETLHRAHTDKLSYDDISIEMNALKFSHHMSIQDFAHGTFLGLFDIIVSVLAKQNILRYEPMTVTIKTTLQSTLTAWHKLFKKYNDDEKDQVAMIRGLQYACMPVGFVQNPSSAASSSSAPTSASQSKYTPFFALTLQFAYDLDIFTEDAIAEWAETLQEREGPDHILLKQSAPLRKWLAEADEEDDEEEDEE